MTIDQMRKSLDIFAKYDKRGENAWWCAGADHDIVWSSYGETHIEENSEDGKRLTNLGWHLSSEFDCWSMFT